MKSFRWLTLVAALLITVCEVLVFSGQAARTPRPPVTLTTGTDADSNTLAPGV